MSKEVGTTTTPLLEHTGPTPLDKYPTMSYRESSSNKQHSLHNSNSHTMVRCLQIWDRRVQCQRHVMALVHPRQIAWRANAKPNGVS